MAWVEVYGGQLEELSFRANHWLSRCLFVCPLTDSIMLILVWFERSLPPAQVADKVVLDC